MGWNRPDVYYNPEEFDLEIIGSLDDPEASYSFDLLVVWKHEDGRVFWASDSGCSCPSPFEDYTSLESLSEVTDYTWPEFQKEVEGHCLYDWRNDGDRSPDPLAADRTQLLGRAAAALGRTGLAI